MTSTPEMRDNLSEASRLLTEAREEGAALAVLPENFAYMGAEDADRLAVAESWGEGPIQDFLRREALEKRLWLVGGTVPVRGEGGKARSASLLFDPQGRCAARYDKIHLFDVGIPGSVESYQESATTVAGSEAVTADTPLGRIGMAVCYDIRFPALFQRLTDLGMDILVLPAAFTVPTGEAHWSVLARARAIEALCYVVAAGQWGEHSGGRQTYGHSMIVDPWGRVLATRTAGAGVVTTDLDIIGLERLREDFPALQHRHRF